MQFLHLKEKHNIESFVVDTPLCFDVYNKKIKKDGYSITITQPEHNSLRVIEVPKKDGKEIVRKMYSEQKDMKIPSYLIPRCPVCGKKFEPIRKTKKCCSYKWANIHCRFFCKFLLKP